MVVVNRRARRASAALSRLYDALAQRGLRVASFHPACNGGEAARYVKRAAKAGADAIVVGGGDGTLTRAVGALAHRSTILGVLPLGTGNSFARSLRVPVNDLDAALDVVAAGRIATIDVGVVNGTYFANFATIGVSTSIAAATTHGAKALFGMAGYVLAALRPLLRHRGFHASIRWDGGELALHTQDIILANGRDYGGTPITPDATLDDGKLTLYTTENDSTLGVLRTYLAIGIGAQTKLADAHVVNADRFEIHAKPKQCINIDGHVLGCTPARFHIARRALRVFVPGGGIARG